MGKIVTFGEVMGRIMPDGLLRFRQALPGTVKMNFAGAEANVAASIAYLGGQSSFVTALPSNDISEACISQLKMLGVDISNIVHANQGRLGLYYTETGANQRPSRVIYDREHSAISLTPAREYDWDKIMGDADWFHLTGITPALSQCSAEVAIASVQKAKQYGVTVSCDLNFRSKLWQWDTSVTTKELARRTMVEILAYVDVLIANEEDAEAVLGIGAKNTDVHSGQIDIEQYQDVCHIIKSKFPNIKKIATTFRESISASYNRWGAMLFDAELSEPYYAPVKGGKYSPYEITNIVDRVGGGDSFAAGLIFALCHPELCGCQTAVSFAVAASCLAHSIVGDYNFNRYEEVLTLMNGIGTGRVVR